MKFLYFLAVFILISGCRSTPDSTNFDLDRANLKDSPNIGINVQPRFSSTLPSSTKMIFYFQGNEVKYDMFNNWAQTPQDLLARYIMLYFNNPEKPIEQTVAKGCTINGTIYDFECDTNTSEVVFTIGITVVDSNENVLMSKLYTSKTKLEKLTASDFAIAMSKAVNDVLKQVYNDIKNLKK